SSLPCQLHTFGFLARRFGPCGFLSRCFLLRQFQAGCGLPRTLDAFGLQPRGLSPRLLRLLRLQPCCPFLKLLALEPGSFQRRVPGRRIASRGHLGGGGR
ncbi:MAG TPA: hypothetical protein PLA97_03525, partial [Rubrivivax sp.]|nr:hypothetical protein [Rubrivivax sp.]